MAIKDTNPFNQLGSLPPSTGGPSPLDSGANTNPFNDLGGKNMVGFTPEPIPETSFSKVQRYTAESKKMKAEADKANSFGGLLKETLKPTNLAKATWDLTKTVFNNPKEAAKEAALGFASGLTLGGTDYLQRRAFVKEATKGGMTEEQARQLAEVTLRSEDPNLRAIRGGADFASIVVPYAGLEKAWVAGLKYAAPKFVAQYGRTAALLADIGAFNTAGQTYQSFLPKEQQNRGQQAIFDTATAGVLGIGANIFRSIRGTPFKSPFETTPVVNKNALIPHDMVVTADALRTGAQERIAQLESKAFMRGNQAEELSFLKKNLDNPDELYRFNAAPSKTTVPVADAKSSMTIKTGAVDEATGIAKGPEIRVATNDVPSLQNYIKGSGDISYKLVDDLGRDAKGREIQARHEFNSSTGVHTIYATEATTAGQLAHELGHYFDTKLTQTTNKLSAMLPAFEKNREAIEDTLASFAVQRLGGNATSEQVSKEIAGIVQSLQREIDTLSSVRRGKLITSQSERFADAVSEIATKEGASAKAPVLTEFLRHSEKQNTVKLFGDAVEKELKDSTSYQSAAPKEAAKAPVPKESAPAPESGPAPVQETINKDGHVIPESAPVKEAPKKSKGTKKEAPKLDRGETGKKPETEAIRAEKMTTDVETEKFMREKVLPNVTGKERIGRSNEDITKAAFSSKLTEESFNKILGDRVGNLSADVVKAKQIIADSALSLKTKLAGRDMAELSGAELKDVMSDYSKLVQTFEVFAGARTEISNTFRSLGIGVAPGENDVLRNALEVIQKAIGGETNPFEIMKKAVAIQEKGPVAKYFEVWYPALLSGPKTSARNIVGNLSNLTLDVLSNAFTKEGRREIWPMMRAIIDGQKEAFNKAGRVLRGEDAILSKIYEPSVPVEKTFKGKLAFLNKLEYVGRFLNAQDSYFSSIAKDAEIAGQRVGKYTYGIENPEIASAVNDAVATAYAQNVTFRNQFEKTFVGEIASKASALKTSDNAGVRTFANFFVPFVKTVANITDRRIDFTPILNIGRTFGDRALYEQRAGRVVKEAGLFTKMFEEGLSKDMSSVEARAFAESEVTRVKEIVIDRLRNKQMGKFYMGMSVMAAGVPLAIAGRITGNGPKNKNERDTLLATGWRPNSIIMPNGVALPYQNLATPLASIFSMLGNLSDAYKYNDTGDNSTNIADATFGFMKSELDQSFLSGISNLYDGMTGYTPKEKVLSNLAISAIPIPAAWSQTKDILFPERYDAKTFNEQLKNKLGITGDFFGTGLTEPLQPKLDAFGNKVKSDLIYGLTPPLLNSKTDDPVLNFMLENNIGIAKPNMGNKIKGRGGQERPMTKEEYTNFVKTTGEKVYDALQPKIESGYFDKFDTKKEKQDAINSIIKKIRADEKSNIRY